ncbi:hypothetical protein [Nitrogeniibacter aestuarii]|uniref:hypothetical protein n=1 Tax=Nitrogeniibacter aestuarii TaxID=2815343 RepID=UPI001D12AC5B|nr:hypothetical protein [Nitrogeniibacter aestuarii]
MAIITLKLGESTQNLKPRITSIPVKTNETAGVLFAKLNWTPPDLGHLYLENSGRVFELRNVFSVMSLEDSDLDDEGILSYSVLLGLTPDERISHDVALTEMNAILQRALSAGWLPYTPRGRPRLTGQDRIQYVLNESALIGLDATTPLTLDQWLRLEDSTEWKFYGNGAYLNISFRRQPQPVIPDEMGIYLVSVEIMTSRSFEQSHVKPEDRSNWEKALPAELSKLAEIRKKRETELIDRGIAIDSTYQDPPISISQ